VCVRPTTYSKNHIPFSFSFSNDWDGQCGRQLKPKYVSYAWFCPYNSIRCFSLHGARWSYFTRQVHKPPDLIFFKLEIIGIIVLCPGTRSMHIRPYAYCSPPYCTCSCEKCFFYKIRKKVLKKQPVQYQICRYSKPKSIQFGKIQKQENHKVFKCFHSMLNKDLYVSRITQLCTPSRGNTCSCGSFASKFLIAYAVRYSFHIQLPLRPDHWIILKGKE